MAFFGPSVGIVVSRRTPAGIFVRSSSNWWIDPVRRYSSIFAAIDAPTFGIARRAAASMPSISRPYPPTDRAAFS
ncbi:hypothetical protein GCM10027612_51400 [Microbispora bryophytorum subsp. camponoti]